MQLAAPSDLLYTGETPPASPLFPRPVKGSVRVPGWPILTVGACTRVTNSLQCSKMLNFHPGELDEGDTRWP